jgi:hypothetical protein
MDQTLSLGWTQDRAASARSAYRRFFKLALLIECGLALAALIAPEWFSSLMGGGEDRVAGDSDWLRAWALVLLFLAFIQLPAPRDPARKRWLNIAAIFARLFQAIAYAILGLLWLGLLEAALFIILALLFHRYAIAELMTRP